VSRAREPMALVRVDAARLEAAIAASRLRAADLSHRAGTTSDVLRRLRQGGPVTWRTLQRVAEVLDVDPATLLAETEEPSP
jgi:hypothetical protein